MSTTANIFRLQIYSIKIRMRILHIWYPVFSRTSSNSAPRHNGGLKSEVKSDRRPDSVEEKFVTGTATDTTEATPRVGPTLTQAEMEALMKKVGSFV